jgi:hypothetical protein
MKDNWRIRIELPEEQHAESVLGRLGLDLGTDEAKQLANELEGRRLAVSRDGNELFVYASSPAEAERVRQIVQAEATDLDIRPRTSELERWLPDEERWTGQPPELTWEQEEVKRGYAPWEVRVERETHAEADELADELERDGYDVVRRWRYLIVGASSEEEARDLAQRVRGAVEPGGELVWEVTPQNPFAVFGGLGSAL